VPQTRTQTHTYTHARTHTHTQHRCARIHTQNKRSHGHDCLLFVSSLAALLINERIANLSSPGARLLLERIVASTWVMQAELQMPERSDAVVHLRVGDVIEDSRVSAKHFLCSWVAINAINGTNIFARARYYTYPLSHWEYVAEEFHSMGIHNVTIIAGSHKNGTESKSCAYVHKVHALPNMTRRARCECVDLEWVAAAVSHASHVLRPSLDSTRFLVSGQAVLCARVSYNLAHRPASGSRFHPCDVRESVCAIGWKLLCFYRPGCAVDGRPCNREQIA
jgi:hypothetical protein